MQIEIDVPSKDIDHKLGARQRWHGSKKGEK